MKSILTRNRTKTVVGATSLLLLSTAAGSLFAQERIRNGGFSDGLNGWVGLSEGTSGGTTRTYGQVPDGGGAARVTVAVESSQVGTGGQAWLTQCAPVNPGSAYVASGRARMESGPAGTQLPFYLLWYADAACTSFLPKPGGGKLYYEEVRFSPSPEWALARLAGTVPAGAAAVSFQFSILLDRINGPATALFDDASFFEGDPTPVVTSFTANPAEAFAGQNVTLSWVTESTGVCIDGIGNGCAVPTALPASGSTTVAPTATTTYTLRASRGGRTTMATRTVTVRPRDTAPARYEFTATTGALVFSFPSAAITRAFAWDAAGLLVGDPADPRARRVAQAIVGEKLGPEALSAYLEAALSTALDAAEPLAVVPLARGAAVGGGGGVKGIEAIGQTKVGAVVVLDFVGTSKNPQSLPGIVDLSFGLADQALHLPLGLLDATDLSRMTAERSYLIVPPAAVDLYELRGFELCVAPHAVTIVARRIGGGPSGEVDASRTAALALEPAATGCPTSLNLPAGEPGRVAGTPRGAATTVYVTRPDVPVAGAGVGGLAAAEPCPVRLQAQESASGATFADVEVPEARESRVDLGVVPAAEWHLLVTSRCAGRVGLLQAETPARSDANTRVLPIALDVSTATARYTTELAITNRSSQRLGLGLTFQPSLGSRAGGGSVDLAIGPGQQLRFDDAIAALRSAGLAIPQEPTDPKGGSLRAEFRAAGALDSADVAVTARTTSPVPGGAAGLAYSGEERERASGATKAVFGLRQTERDRSNLALYNPGDVPVTLRVTIHSGSGDGRTAVVADGVALEPLGWKQIDKVLVSAGFEQGWAVVERTSATGVFGAYGVVNDNGTNDGSFIAGTDRRATGSRVAIPVIVETTAFRSELVVANSATEPATLRMSYVESLRPDAAQGGEAEIVVPPATQLLIGDAAAFLRERGVAIPTAAQGGAAGTIRVKVAGVPLGSVFVAARVSSQSEAGSYGLFVPGIPEGEAARVDAVVAGLVSDERSRSNVAIANVGDAADGSVTLEIRCFDGEAGGVERGGVEVATLAPGQWKQLSGILRTKGIRSGWATVRRSAGKAIWLAYGIVNDGAAPGQGTGDGAVVPMTPR